MTTRNTSGLRRGGRGRQKGVSNKATLEVRDAARAITEDPVCKQKMLEQHRRGRLHPSVIQMLYAYAYGKPKDTLRVEEALEELVVRIIS